MWEDSSEMAEDRREINPIHFIYLLMIFRRRDKYEAEVGQKFKFKGNSMNIHQLLKLLLVEKKSDGQFTGENRYLMNIHQRSRWIFILIIAKKNCHGSTWNLEAAQEPFTETPSHLTVFSQLVRQLTSHMCILPYISNRHSSPQKVDRDIRKTTFERSFKAPQESSIKSASHLTVSSQLVRQLHTCVYHHIFKQS